MPGNLATAVILALWVGTMGWLLIREIGPFDDAPPAFHEILAATPADQSVNWRMRKYQLDAQGEVVRSWELGMVQSTVRHDRRTGQYTLEHTADLDAAELLQLLMKAAARFPLPEGVRLQLDSRSEVSVLGDLQRMRLKLRLNGVDWSMLITGAPDRYGALPLTIDFVMGGASYRWEHKLAHDGKGMLLNSLCPLDRMPGLKAGQRWRAPLINPLGTGSSDVLVQVMEEPLKLNWDDKDISCLVVESKRSGMTIQIWVAQGGELDGMVLKQRVHWDKTQVEIERQPEKPAASPQSTSPTPTKPQ
jgi:hypothetical protein